jgi:hypothetical protein
MSTTSTVLGNSKVLANPIIEPLLNLFTHLYRLLRRNEYLLEFRDE